MQPSPLNPATAERLVILRFMLTEAQQRCRDGTSVGRHIGLLTLQDTCELAMILVLDDLGEQHAETERFDDLYSKVAEKLPDKAWKPRNQWASVRLMNRARNGAQHHGQRADKDQLNQWVTAADTFVRSLITSQFGIDLRTAVAASAIADQTLRQDLSDAEEALYDGRITESVQRAAAVFDLARRRWHRQLNDIDSRSHAGRAHHPHDEIDMLTDRLDDLEEVRHFAPDTIGHLRINHLARSLSLGPPDLPVLSEKLNRCWPSCSAGSCAGKP